MNKKQKVYKRRFPNLVDLQFNPTFYMKRHDSANRFNHFYNLLDDRGFYVPGIRVGYKCEICAAPIQRRKKRKFLVCQRCLHKYLREVELGVRVAKPYIEVYAV
jgi:DNA-directed RNA polymerase subunit RPC12/RpoP